jgi:hypothetical protein
VADADLSQYDPIFQAAGTEWNVDPTLLKAVAAQESGGNPRAVSPAGARGLMQIMPGTGQTLGMTDLNDPVQSIYGAAKYLNTALDAEGSPEKALLYYHGGPGWRGSYGRESQNYVPGVTANYQRFAKADTGTATDASPSPPAQPPSQPPLIIGDSLASPGGLGGSGVVGANPGAIRSVIGAGVRNNAYQGRDVVLSSGASNAPGDMTNVEGQLQNLKQGGAGNVTLLGVGPGIETKNPGTNDALQALAGKYGIRFQPLPTDQMGPDGVHPTGAGYKTLRGSVVSPAASSAPPAATAPPMPTASAKPTADDDPLKLLPPAPAVTSASPQGSAPAAAGPQSDSPLSMLPPAPKSVVPPATAAAAPPPDPTQGYFGPDGNYVPPQAMPTKEQAAQFDPEKILPIMPRPTPGSTNILDAAREGFEGSRIPGVDEWAPGGVPLGRYIVNPLAQLGGAIFRGGQEAVSSAVGQINPQLGRDVAALPEAFPTGGGEFHPLDPPTAQAARTKLAQPITVEDLTGAIKRSDAAAAADRPTPSPAASALNPDQAAREAAAQADLEARLRSSAETIRQAREARGAPSQDGTTGLQNLGGAAQAIGDNLRQMWWDKLQKGDTTEFGKPSPVLVAAKQAMDSGSIATRADFDQFAQNYYAAQRQARTAAAPSAAAEAAAGPEMSADEAPRPQAAGAAATAPGDIPAQTNVERARNLRVAINESAKDRAGTSLRDDSTYVDNIPPRVMAQRDFDTDASLTHKYAYNTDPAYKAAYDAHDTARNSGMVDNLRADAGDEITLDQLRKDRRNVAPDQFGAFDGERPVNAQPIETKINNVLDSAEGKRDAVERTLNNVKAKLYDSQGNLETMPSKLYGVDQHISDLLNKAARPLDREGSDAQVAQFVLRDLQDQVRNTIQSGAPKFRAYRQAYSDFSQPINQQRFLQRYQGGSKKLTGSDGMLQLPRVNQMLEDIHKGLGDTKFNLAQSLTDDQIQNVINTRNELAARKLLHDQAAVPGSPTVQLLSRAAEKGGGALGNILHTGAMVGAHAVAAHLGLPLAEGAVGAYQVARPLVQQVRRQGRMTRAAQAEAVAKQRLLSTPPQLNALNPTRPPSALNPP